MGAARGAFCPGPPGRRLLPGRPGRPAEVILGRVHFTELSAPEQRVLGCLIEKRWTTPDQYPLSLNALRLACNQTTNRDPVTDYDEATVRDAAQRLSRYGLARLASGHSSRAVKYRHLAEEALGLGREELAVLAVLLLRGPQTPGELKARTERMAQLGSLADVERVLGALAEHELARRSERRPGQKEDRYEQLLGGGGGCGRRGRCGDRGRAATGGPRPPRSRSSTVTSPPGCRRSRSRWRDCATSSRPCEPANSAAPARSGRWRRRRSPRRVSSPAPPTTSCAALPATWPRRPGSAPPATRRPPPRSRPCRS